MSIPIKNYLSLFLCDYILEEKRLVDIDFNAPTCSFNMDLYKQYIDRLEAYEANIRRNFNSKINKIKTMPSANDDDQFDIEKELFDNQIMFYYSDSKRCSLITVNQYARSSDIKMLLRSNKVSISTYPILVASSIRRKIYLPFRNVNFLDISIHEKFLDLSFCDMPNFDHINKIKDLNSLQIYESNPMQVESQLELPNLNCLYIASKNTIPNLDKLPLLSILSVVNSKIPSSIDFLSSNLTSISFCDCGLNTFDFNLPETLTSLRLTENNLEYLKVSLPNLTNLDVEHNKIYKLDLVGLKNLIHLYASNNHLTNIELGGSVDQVPVRSIRRLHLKNNHLVGVKLLNRGLERPTMQDINLSNNKLESIDDMFDNTPHLTKVNISHNHLDCLPFPLFPMCLDIEEIDISNNTNIDAIPYDSISHLKSLKSYIPNNESQVDWLSLREAMYCD